MAKDTLRLIFELNFVAQPGERVCLTGDTEELGNWHHSKGVFLYRKMPSNPDRCSIWTTEVTVPTKASFSYRYYACYVLNPSIDKDSDNLIITRWEANPTPRTWERTDESSKEVKISDQFCYIDGTGENCSSRGWLTVQSEVHLVLFPDSINLWQHGQQLTSIRCIPHDKCILDACQCSQLAIQPWSKVSSYVLTETDYKPTVQEPNGIAYQSGNIMTFRIQVQDTTNLSFKLDFYGTSSTHIGYAYILPSMMTASMGQTVTYISSNDKEVVGEVKGKYCIAKPLVGHHCSFDFSTQQLLKFQKQPVHVGHRGMGNSFDTTLPVMENTIASFNAARQYGADYTEMDVQITKDLIPVVYHDYTIAIAMEQRVPSTPVDNHKRMSVKDLTLDELQTLKLFHHQQEPSCWIPISDAIDSHSQPFPTLLKCLDEVPEDIGFNLEIKYPCERIDGELEENDFYDANQFLDIILTHVLKHYGNRKIIFSTFEPDICLMLRLKQNKYPVMFLTMGKTDKWIAFKDPRSQTTEAAISYAEAECLTGVCANVENLLKKPNLIKTCQEKKLILLSWGAECDDHETQEILKQYEINGFIHNRMDLYGPASTVKTV